MVERKPTCRSNEHAHPGNVERYAACREASLVCGERENVLRRASAEDEIAADATQRIHGDAKREGPDQNPRK